LRFEECFWDPELRCITVTTDVPDEMFTFSSLKFSLDVDVFIVEIVGPYVQEMAQLSDDQVVSRTMAVLRHALPEAPEAPLEATPVARWAVDGFACGSYSFVAVGAEPSMVTALGQPVGSALFFAGEATDLEYIGTVHGALLTGRRAAAKALGDPTSDLEADPTFQSRARCEDTADFSDHYWVATNATFHGNATTIGFVDYSENSLERIIGLDIYPQLQFLDVADNDLTSLDGVTSAPCLRFLNASSNELRSLRGIEGCQSLQWLDLSDNNISTVDGLSCLPALRQLSLASNNLRVLKPLESCGSLEVLDVQDNNLTDAAALVALRQACIALRTVRIWNNDYSKAGVRRLNETFGTACSIQTSKVQELRFQNLTG